MTTVKHGNHKASSQAPRLAAEDSGETKDLVAALDALEISQADDPTPAETHALRRDVVDASAALERKQPRRRPTP